MAIDKIIVDETTGVEAAQIINETIDLAESNVQSVVAGTNVTVDDTDPNNPIVNAEGGGIEGSQYIFVTADGTDIENAAELQAAYDEAKTLTPSATNRITVIAAPGNYNFETNEFIMDTQFIDLVSLDGNRSVIFNHPLNTGNRVEGSINVTANDVFVKGVNVLTKVFRIENNLNLIRVENCQGGNFSFGGGVTASGTFTDCQGGNDSWGGGFGTASGTFTNCQGGFGSFAGIGGTASGTFTDCVGGTRSFGDSNTASGTFTNCQGGNDSFAGRFGGTASGTFTNCVSGFRSFGRSGTASGTFTNCIGGSDSFGGNGTASGTFTNCISASSAFGGADGTITGKLIRCQLTLGTFQTPTETGKIVLGIDGNDDIINLTA